MLSVVLETALVAVEGKSGAVFLLSARRSELYVKVGRHLAPQIAEQRIPIGRGIVGWAAEHRKAVVIPSHDAPVPEDPEPTEATALAVPLESQSQLLGVLVIYGRQNNEPFRDEDLDTITSLARQAGVGIENVLLHQEAQRLSITDGLTGIWNYRYFQMQMAQHFAAAVRFEHRLSLLVIDIDRFKDVNDRYGHQRGDTTLVELARRVVMHTRLNIDTLARYGGEEFVLILPETGLQGARIVAEKIREEVASTPFGEEGDEPIDVSVSIGYASYPEHGLTQQALVDAADKAMYEAKARGRNRVVGADELGF
jgi:two-component system, cell cycle response regulator